ncbi:MULTISPECIES: hypothetical protein [Streptomyces]|uniref:hypothetical protein n=1 Tax=Streptomyces TaxID=1883 RepID=UPI00364E4DAD
MLCIKLTQPLPLSAPGRLSQFSDVDDWERPDLREGVDIIVLGVNSVDWGTPDGNDSVLACITESFYNDSTDTWVEYCPQSGLTSGEIVQCNLRELTEHEFELLIEKIGESLAEQGCKRDAMAHKIRHKKGNND